MLASGQEFDVILTDLNMPQMDGIELMRHLAERQYGGGIVLLTGEHSKVLQSANMLAKAHQLRLLGVLQKPFSLGLLGALLGDAGRATDIVPAIEDQLSLSMEELATGIREGQILPYFQPRVSTQSGRVIGVEALARWWHPEKGMVMPGVFIPLAEQSGLIGELSQVIIKAAIARIGEWRAQGLCLRLSANVTADDLLDIEVPDRLSAWCEAAGVPPTEITLELTESQLMSKLERTLDTLIRLRLKGVNLAIDDFGTGYSNLGQIKRAPFSELKIDRSFVCDGVKDDEGRAILQASIAMGKQLGLAVVAEGVETEAEWDAVRLMGADEVQGYWISAPMPAREVPGWIDEWLTHSVPSEA
jgi:EAL domain-containing protein (putative c-di-GMP-specific phosphodiesterase class I)